MSLARAVGLLAALLLAGCGNISYYTQLAGGQIELLRAREPIAEIVRDESRDPRLRQRLGEVLEARAWAVRHLHLPDNGSYTSYADLQRPFVVWNVFATPELSLEPVQNCFLLVGCLAYRGFFDKAGAEAHAEKLRARDLDVHVGGVPAYSTLGWFDDPVINSMMHWSDEVLIGTVFHELAHQLRYVKDDTAFNESYAEFVEEEGLRQYLEAHGRTSTAESERRRREGQFVRLMLATRERLGAIYRSGAPPEEQRAGKRAEFERLTAEFERLRAESWGGYAGYDGWFRQGELNNARLLPFGLYDEWQPAFRALFLQEGREWPRFHAAVEALAALEPAQRAERLKALQRRAQPE